MLWALASPSSWPAQTRLDKALLTSTIPDFSIFEFSPTHGRKGPRPSAFAKKLKLKSTGHASGIHNLFVTDTNYDLNIIEDLYNPINNRSTINKLEKCTNLIEQMENGLIVTETIGHGVNLVTGDYSKGIVGFWVQNQQIVYPVEETTIASNLNSMFKNILGLGSDFNYQSNIITGSILIDDITIAGT
jgi:PmbA protein